MNKIFKRMVIFTEINNLLQQKLILFMNLYQQESLLKCNLKKDISTTNITYIKRNENIYCIICYHFCHSFKFDTRYDIVVKENPAQCSCINHLDNQKIKNKITKLKIEILNLSKNDKIIEFLRKNALINEIFRKIKNINLFTQFDKIQQTSVIEYIKHVQTSRKDISKISKIIQFLRFLKLQTTPVVKLENLFQFDYQKILNNSLSKSEQKHYHAVAELKTTTMNFLQQTTFRNLIYDLQQLDYQTLGSINLIARIRIRERNLKKVDEENRKKWLKNIMNWIKLYITEDSKDLILSFEKVIQKTFYYPIKFARDMVINGLIKNQIELKDLKDLLYSKINILIGIQNHIANLLHPSSQIKQIATCLRQIREFFLQIMYQFFFLQNDFEFIEAIKNNSEINKLKTYEQEFSKKTLQICIKYALAPITIQGDDLIYNPQNTKIIELILKFLPIVNNIQDSYLKSLWLTKNRDIMHQRLIKKYQQENIFNILHNVSEQITKLMNDYFDNYFIYQQQELINSFTSEIEEVIQQSRIQNKINILKQYWGQDKMIPDKLKNQIYKQQLIFLESNLLQKIIMFSNYFLISNQFNIKKAREKVFIIFKFVYFKNNVNISIFLQKSNFQKISIKFPDQVFDLLYFGFIHNWIIYSHQELLVYIQQFWNSKIKLLKQIQNKTDPQWEQIYAKLKQILIFLRKWNDIQHHKLQKYLPATDICIIQQILKIMDIQIKIQNIKTIFLYKEGKQLSSKQQFQFYYLETIIFFSEKRYQYTTYKQVRNIFTIQFIQNMIITNLTPINIRAKSILMAIIEYFYIDVKNNLLDNRKQINQQIKLKYQYGDLVTSKQSLDLIINILYFELAKFLEIYVNRNDQKKQKQYFYKSILPPLLRLLIYFGMIPNQQSSMISKYQSNVQQLLKIIILMVQKKYFIQNLQRQKSHINKIKELINNDIIFKKKIVNNTDEFQQIYIFLANQIKSLFKEVDSLKKYNHFLDDENKECTKNMLLWSKFQRQYLYSNKHDIRIFQLKSNLIKYKNVNAQKQHLDSFIYKLQNSYENLKIALTSTETRKNSYFSQILSHNQQKQLLIENLFRHIIHQLSIPKMFKDQNIFYNVVECLCNILFVARINIKNMLYKYSQFDKPGKVNWIINIWKQMLHSIILIKIKSNKDLVWIDQYLRFRILIKFTHSLIQLNNKDWKKIFLNTNVSNDTSNIQFQLMFIISEEIKWNFNYLHDNLDDSNHKHSQYILIPACAILELFTELIRSPLDQIKQNVYTDLLLQINGILKKYTKNYNSWLYQFKLKCIQFLLYLIEDENKQIIKFIIQNYSVTNLNTIMINSVTQLYYGYIAEKQGKQYLFYNKKTDKTIKIQDLDDLYKYYVTDKTFANHNLLNLAYKIYLFMIHIKKFSIKYRFFLQQRIENTTLSLKPQQILTYKFLNKISSSIQFLCQGKLYVLPFKIPGKCIYLTEQTKNFFLQIVNRDTPQDKIRDLIREFKYFKIEMDYHQEKFASNFQVFNHIIPRLEYIQYFIYALAFIINILLIYDLSQRNSNQIINLPSYIVYITLGYIIVFLSIITWFIRIFFNFKLFYELQTKRKEDLLPKDDTLSNFQKFLIASKILFFYPDSFVLIFNFTVTLIAINLTVFCFSLLLLMLIFRIQTLKYIVRAIWLHIDQLAVAYVLQIIIIYIYAFISYENYAGRFLFVKVLQDNNSEPFNEEYCTTIIQCLTNLMNQAIVTANGIGSLMGLQSFTQSNRAYYFARFFSDVSFYIILNVIFLNIIQGIIIDTFGQLRDKFTKKIEDQKNVCFICNQNKDSLISKAQSFQTHINTEHNIWNYVNFLVYIDEKHEKDCQGRELKLKQLIQDQDSSWVPIIDNNENDQQVQNKIFEERLKELDLIVQQYQNEYKINL